MTDYHDIRYPAPVVPEAPEKVGDAEVQAIIDDLRKSAAMEHEEVDLSLMDQAADALTSAHARIGDEQRQKDDWKGRTQFEFTRAEAIQAQVTALRAQVVALGGQPVA